MNVLLFVLLLLPAISGWVTGEFGQLCLAGLAVGALWLPARPKRRVRRSARGGADSGSRLPIPGNAHASVTPEDHDRAGSCVSPNPRDQAEK
jgi:hypothetical protein